MRSWFRSSFGYFAAVAAAALALRLWFVFQFPVVAGDAWFYGDLAKNWLQLGILGVTGSGGVEPSLVRLPGYPAFLASIWAFTGAEHYRAVLLAQALIDVGACFLTADLAGRMLRTPRAVKGAFLLAAICPFTANYAACALTETLAVFFTVLALDLAVAALDSGRAWRWAACGAAVGAGILIRPDGGILLPVIAGYLLALGCRSLLRRETRGWGTLGGTRVLLFSALALAPLAPWTLRNWRDFHVVQPLAPRYATDPGQFVPLGFQRWMKTWIADYVSVAEIYWPLDEETIDISRAPLRAFDSNGERQAVASLFARYNVARQWTPELDRALGEIAARRIAEHRLRYYLWLPALRMADMWLRPRTEMLGVNDRWWRVEEDPGGAAVAMALGALNLFYVAAAALGILALWRRRGAAASGLTRPPWGVLLAFVMVRTLFLGTLENPEPRYTLECYPVVLVLAAALFAGARLRSRRQCGEE